MPEGHTVHRLARVISEEFAGQRVITQSPQGRFAAGAALLDNQVLTGTEAIGKHLLVHFAPTVDHPPQHTLHVHLGLYGAWSFAADSASRLAHAIGAPRKRMGERESAPVRLSVWLSWGASGGVWWAGLPYSRRRSRIPSVIRRYTVSGSPTPSTEYRCPRPA